MVFINPATRAIRMLRRMKIDWLIFWISALATYRLTVFVARDLGPCKIFKRLRALPYIGAWAKCPFCVSPYMGALICVGLWLSGYVEPLPVWILLCLAWSAITIAVDRTFSGDYVNN